MSVMNEPVVYKRIIFSKWDMYDEPDENGVYQVRCRNCGNFYTFSPFMTGRVNWCDNCGAYMVEGELPEDALTASEVADDAAAV